MADSDFWRNLAKEFRAVDPQGFLIADWHFDFNVETGFPPIPEWRLRQDGFTRSIRLEFEALARRAGPKVHPLLDSLDGWLEAIRESGLVDTEYERAIWGGSAPLGSILRVCLVSADLCKQYESLALEAERIAGSQHDYQGIAEQQQSQGPAVETSPGIKHSSIPNAEPVETIAAQLRRLREESRLTIQALTEALGDIDSRSVERHLSGDAVPRIGNIGAYERVFSNVLHRKIVIVTTPSKRR